VGEWAGMVGVSLHEVAILLAALAIAGPLARWLGISEVLGYLVVGMLLGPNTIGWSFSDYKAKEILHFAEFGIVLLLFLIGLELRPKRLWAMRYAVFVLGTEQVLLTGAVLAGIGLLVGFSWQTALFAGLALALSSTAWRCKSWRRPATSIPATAVSASRCCCSRTWRPFR
jgi:glutathione-regulated potassium-efflux system protein KefB